MTPRSAVPIVWPKRAVRYGSQSHAQCCVTKRVKIQDCWCDYAAVCLIVRKNISSYKSARFGDHIFLHKDEWRCFQAMRRARHARTYTQILSSLALQTGEDAAQVSLDRAIKWIDHSTASVNSSSPARTQHTVPLMGNREVKTRGVEIEYVTIMIQTPNFRWHNVYPLQKGCIRD